MRTKRFEPRALLTLLAIMLCMTAFSVSASASGGDYYDDELPPTSPGVSSFTPDGNLTLVDDYLFSDEDGDGNVISKQFITVRSKSNNYFYIVIDRAGTTENVYFLNLVDEADLFALTGDGEEPEPPVCTCDDKCYAGHVDTSCPVCAVNMTECVGREPQPEPTPEPTEPVVPDTPDKPGTGAVGLVVLLILAVVCGAACYVLKVRGKANPKTKGGDDLDDYDYGEDSGESEDEYAEFERAGESDGDADDPDSGESEPYYPDSGGEGPGE